MKPVKGKRARRAAMISAVTALMLGLSAPVALGSITITPAAPGPYESGGAYPVKGVPPAGKAQEEGTHVTLAVCNLTEAPGKLCDKEGSVGFRTLGEYAIGIPLELERGPWFNWDFTKGMPEKLATETTCKNIAKEGEPCGVVVSYYKLAGEEVAQLDAEVAPIEFE